MALSLRATEGRKETKIPLEKLFGPRGALVTGEIVEQDLSRRQKRASALLKGLRFKARKSKAK